METAALTGGGSAATGVADLGSLDRDVPDGEAAGAPPDADLAVWLGSELADRWRPLDALGGTSSRVVLAHDERLGRLVVLKVLLCRGTPDADRLAEAHVQAILADHPNVVSLHEAGIAPSGLAYLVLEYAPGGTLAAGQQRSLPELLRLGAELSSAVAFCHQHDVVHGDVKPSNVLIGADGSARLADFGIAGHSADVLGTLDDVRGSLHYAAPELFDGAGPSSSADVYALAVTLWTAATGRVPFGGLDAQPSSVMARVQRGGLRFEATRFADVGAEIVEMLDAAASLDPRDRPSAASVHAALSRVARRATGGETGDGRRPRGGASRRVTTVAVFGVLALLGALVAVTSLRAGGSRPETGASTSAGAAVAVGASYCEVFGDAMRERGRLLEDIAAELEVATDPVNVVEHLLSSFPRRFATLTRPWLVRTASLTQRADLALSVVELEELALADSMRSLTGGKAGLLDGADGSISAVDLPGDLRRPAAAVSDATRLASTRCPRVQTDLRAAKARMSSSVVSNLADPTFMAGFFNDPRSLDVISARQVSLMAEVAGPFFGRLLAGHWDFLVRLCDRHPDVRSEITFDHPDVVLAALRVQPDLTATVRNAAWRTDLQRGLDRLAPSERWGIEAVYRPVLVDLGLSPA